MLKAMRRPTTMPTPHRSGLRLTPMPSVASGTPPTLPGIATAPGMRAGLPSRNHPSTAPTTPPHISGRVRPLAAALPAWSASITSAVATPVGKGSFSSSSSRWRRAAPKRMPITASASPQSAIPHPGTTRPSISRAGTAPSRPAAAGTAPAAVAAVWAMLFSSRVSRPEASAKASTEAVTWPLSQMPVLSPM